MSLNLDTNVGVNTAEFDAKIKTASEKAKKNLADVSRGLKMAGPAVGKVASGLKNIGSMGFAGIMSAGVGVLIAGIKKATELANDMFRGAVEDAKAINADLQSSIGRTSRRISSAEDALKILTDAKKNGIANAEQAQVVKEAIARVRQEYSGSMSTWVQKGAAGNYYLSNFDDALEKNIGAQLNQKSLDTIDAQIKSLRNVIEGLDNQSEFLRTNWAQNALSPFQTQKELVQIARERTNYSEQMIGLEEQRKALLAKGATISVAVDARATDRNAQIKAATEAERAADETKKYVEAVRAYRNQIAGITRDQAAGKISKIDAGKLVKDLEKELVRTIAYAEQAAGNAASYQSRAGKYSRGGERAKTYLDDLKGYVSEFEKQKSKLDAAAKAKQIEAINRDRRELEGALERGSREQSQVFTNDLTRRGGFQTGGMLWSNDRYQQQMTARVQTISTQLQTLIRNINQLNTTP